jgi:hypothetical protein
MPDFVTIGSAVVSVGAAAISVWQARYAKQQAVAAEEQAEAARVQARLANAQMEHIKRADGEEQAHRSWLDGVLAELCEGGGTGNVQVAPGDRLHADWALAHGYVDPLGTALILPSAERSKIPRPSGERGS